MATRVAYGLSDAARRYVLAVTGKSAEELSDLNPDDEVALAESVNGSAPKWSRDLKGSFRGRGNINVASRRVKTLEGVDEFLDALSKSGARQY